MIVVRFGPLAVRLLGLVALAVAAFSRLVGAIRFGATSLSGWQAAVGRVAVAVFVVGIVMDPGVWRAMVNVVRDQQLDRRSRQFLASLSVAGPVATVAPLEILPRATGFFGSTPWFVLAVVTLVTSFVVGLVAPGIASLRRRRRVFIVGLIVTVTGFVVLVAPLYLLGSTVY
jgi:hypothetical protein